MYHDGDYDDLDSNEYSDKDCSDEGKGPGPCWQSVLKFSISVECDNEILFHNLSYKFYVNKNKGLKISFKLPFEIVIQLWLWENLFEFKINRVRKFQSQG